MIKINKLFLPYIIVLLIIGFKGQMVVAFLIVFFHEIIHYLTALALGFSGFDIEILPIGAVLSLKDLDEADPKKDILISLSAPVANIIVSIIFYYVYKNTSFPYAYSIYIGNLILGLFNLIPAFPLDGGRVFRAWLALKTIFKRANMLSLNISIAEGILLLIFYFITLFLGYNNINIAVIALFIIISSYKEKERIVYIIMGDIVKKKYKFLKNGYIENKSISIYYKNDLITALSIIDKNKYNIFTILDDELKVMDLIYEEELIDALKEYGNIILEEFIQIREGNL